MNFDCCPKADGQSNQALLGKRGLSPIIPIIVTNDLDGTDAFPAGLDVDGEHPVKSLRPGHRCKAFDEVFFGIKPTVTLAT